MAPPGNQAATEKTNISLYRSENPVYSPKVGPVLKRSAKGKAHGVKLKAERSKLNVPVYAEAEAGRESSKQGSNF